MKENMINECDKDYKRLWVLALSMPIARCVNQDFVEDAAMVCCKTCNG